MDQNKVTDYLFLLKSLIDSQSTLMEYQIKVETMVQLILEKDLIDYPALKLHVYFHALTDSVGSAISFTEDIICALNDITSLMMGLEQEKSRL